MYFSTICRIRVFTVLEVKGNNKEYLLFRRIICHFELAYIYIYI